MGSRSQVLAIAGASGSGKTTLAEALLEALTLERIALLPLDTYYHDLSHLAVKDRESINFDHPEALDLVLFSQHIECLRGGEPVNCPGYDFTTHCRLPAGKRVEARPLIVVEGILVAATSALRDLYDHLVFIEAPSKLRHDRRVHRDQFERGRDTTSIERFWIRAEENFAEWGPLARDNADQIIDGARSPEAMLADLKAVLELGEFA